MEEISQVLIRIFLFHAGNVHMLNKELLLFRLQHDQLLHRMIGKQ